MSARTATRSSTYVSGWCGTTQHERCAAQYAGTDCGCACHAKPPSREHQVVVVFDVTAPDVLSAGRAVVGLINGTRDRYLLQDGTLADTVIESWWMPEEPLRSQVDRNDNTPMRLVPAVAS